MDGWLPVSYAALDGWEADDHQAALACFRMSARGFAENAHVSREAVPPSPQLLAVAQKALRLDPSALDRETARKFFEENFKAVRKGEKSGFVTAYFEPEVEASRTKTSRFPYPLYGRPADLVKIDKENPPAGVTPGQEFARKTATGHSDFPDRGSIDKGALSGQGLELFWLKSAVEGFYIHVQGSARLSFDDGTNTRVSYAGKSGHPYTSIGKELVAQGTFTVDEANMKNMREWLDADEARALELLHRNRSFIFFTEVKGHNPDFGPVAAAGVQLTPGRSLAVDKSIHAYGTPVWLDTCEPLPGQSSRFRRLMMAQDTGSAIVGPERGDIFMGSGDEAGLVAGAVRHHTDFVILIPRSL
ncbi:MAG: MltA domain-containing protein [Pseudomonadota bacterium]